MEFSKEKKRLKMSYAWLAFSKIMASCQKKGFFTRKDWDVLACNVVYRMFMFVSNLSLIISHFIYKSINLFLQVKLIYCD